MAITSYGAGGQKLGTKSRGVYRPVSATKKLGPKKSQGFSWLDPKSYTGFDPAATSFGFSPSAPASPRRQGAPSMPGGIDLPGIESERGGIQRSPFSLGYGPSGQAAPAPGGGFSLDSALKDFGQNFSAYMKPPAAQPQTGPMWYQGGATAGPQPWAGAGAPPSFPFMPQTTTGATSGFPYQPADLSGVPVPPPSPGSDWMFDVPAGGSQVGGGFAAGLASGVGKPTGDYETHPTFMKQYAEQERRKKAEGTRGQPVKLWGVSEADRKKMFGHTPIAKAVTRPVGTTKAAPIPDTGAELRGTMVEKYGPDLGPLPTGDLTDPAIRHAYATAQGLDTQRKRAELLAARQKASGDERTADEIQIGKQLDRAVNTVGELEVIIGGLRKEIGNLNKAKEAGNKALEKKILDKIKPVLDKKDAKILRLAADIKMLKLMGGGGGGGGGVSPQAQARAEENWRVAMELLEEAKNMFGDDPLYLETQQELLDLISGASSAVDAEAQAQQRGRVADMLARSFQQNLGIGLPVIAASGMRGGSPSSYEAAMKGQFERNWADALAQQDIAIAEQNFAAKQKAMAQAQSMAYQKASLKQQPTMQQAQARLQQRFIA